MPAERFLASYGLENRSKLDDLGMGFDTNAARINRERSDPAVQLIQHYGCSFRFNTPNDKRLIKPSDGRNLLAYGLSKQFSHRRLAQKDIPHLTCIGNDMVDHHPSMVAVFFSRGHVTTCFFQLA